MLRSLVTQMLPKSHGITQLFLVVTFFQKHFEFQIDLHRFFSLPPSLAPHTVEN